MRFRANDSDSMECVKKSRASRSRPTKTNRNQMRKLASVDSGNIYGKERDRTAPLSCIYVVFGAFIILLISCIIVTSISTDVRQQFVENYHEVVSQLSRESINRCVQNSQDFNALDVEIRKNIVGQAYAYNEIVQWLRDARIFSYRLIVFLGSTGVGKTLTAKLIINNYPWRANTFYISWKDRQSQTAQYAVFQGILFKLRQASYSGSLCGNYLIVIDNLHTNDISVLVKIIARIRGMSEKHQINLDIVLVFQGSANLSHSLMEKTIPEAKVVEFSALSRKHLNECIQREASVIGLDVEKTKSLIDAVAKQINVSQYGCKPVRPKLILFSQL
ncbi:uncharacterized protein LOC131213267 [Anopheles bellator]|uniref:uncharacterized protein LOC131213267 n=1 Tax=Anopheles bellator TaxID=139047 RepID=UPI002648E906|nr:uncharacterized protein LOC131213267 [Anopheles bellator]